MRGNALRLSTNNFFPHAAARHCWCFHKIMPSLSSSFKKNEITYTLDYEEGDCDLPSQSCLLDNADPYNLEIC